MISSPLVSFVPATAAQPTDVLRRANGMREVVPPAQANQAFQRERGLGADTERRAQSAERNYPQLLAQARLESGFPGFLRRIEFRDAPNDPKDPESRNADVDNLAAQAAHLPEAYAGAHLQRDDEPIAERFMPHHSVATQTQSSLPYDWQQYAQNDTLNAEVAARGRRIEMYYQSSFRTNEQFLLGIA